MSTGSVQHNGTTYYGIATNDNCKSKVPYSMYNIKASLQCSTIDSNNCNSFMTPTNTISEVYGIDGNATVKINNVTYYRCITKRYLSAIGNNLIAVNSSSALSNRLIRYEYISVSTGGNISLPWYDGYAQKYGAGDRNWVFRIFPSNSSNTVEWRDKAVQYKHSNNTSGVHFNGSITDFSIINDLKSNYSTYTRTAIEVTTSFNSDCNCQIILDPPISNTTGNTTTFYYNFWTTTLEDATNFTSFLNIPFFAFLRLYKTKDAAGTDKPNQIKVNVKADKVNWYDYISDNNKC